MLLHQNPGHTHARNPDPIPPKPEPPTNPMEHHSIPPTTHNTLAVHSTQARSRWSSNPPRLPLSPHSAWAPMASDHVQFHTPTFGRGRTKAKSTEPTFIQVLLYPILKPLGLFPDETASRRSPSSTVDTLPEFAPSRPNTTPAGPIYVDNPGEEAVAVKPRSADPFLIRGSRATLPKPGEILVSTKPLKPKQAEWLSGLLKDFNAQHALDPRLQPSIHIDAVPPKHIKPLTLFNGLRFHPQTNALYLDRSALNHGWEEAQTLYQYQLSIALQTAYDYALVNQVLSPQERQAVLVDHLKAELADGGAPRFTSGLSLLPGNRLAAEVIAPCRFPDSMKPKVAALLEKIINNPSLAIQDPEQGTTANGTTRFSLKPEFIKQELRPFIEQHRRFEDQFNPSKAAQFRPSPAPEPETSHHYSSDDSSSGPTSPRRRTWSDTWQGTRQLASTVLGSWFGVKTAWQFMFYPHYTQPPRSSSTYSRTSTVFDHEEQYRFRHKTEKALARYLEGALLKAHLMQGQPVQVGSKAQRTSFRLSAIQAQPDLLSHCSDPTKAAAKAAYRRLLHGYEATLGQKLPTHGYEVTDTLTQRLNPAELHRRQQAIAFIQQRSTPQQKKQHRINGLEAFNNHLLDLEKHIRTLAYAYDQSAIDTAHKQLKTTYTGLVETLSQQPTLTKQYKDLKTFGNDSQDHLFRQALVI